MPYVFERSNARSTMPDTGASDNGCTGAGTKRMFEREVEIQIDCNSMTEQSDSGSYRFYESGRPLKDSYSPD